MTKEEIEFFLKSDKTDWYETIDKRKKWNKTKVAKFWRLIRQKTDNNFSEYIFPEFEKRDVYVNDISNLTEDENFWKKGEKRVFTEYVSFSSCKFVGDCDFSSVHFEKGIYLTSADFLDDVMFKRSIFNDFCSFFRVNFHKNAYFQGIKFDGYTDFYECIFMGLVTFESSKFMGKVDFKKLTIMEIGNFKNIKFFPNVELTFEDIVAKPRLSFENVIFLTGVLFRRVNLYNTIFTQSDLTEIQFRECEWAGNTRIKLIEENNNADFKALEGLYRQLKTNFDKEKDWELSGRAYRSEMLLRRYRIHLEFTKNWKAHLLIGNKNFWEWLFYWVYGRCSGFTESILTPFFLLIISTIGFALIYYIQKVSNYSESLGMDFLEGFLHVDFNSYLKFSLSKTLPFLEFDEIKVSWWLSSIQQITSSILFVFLILSLRKRFR